MRAIKQIVTVLVFLAGIIWVYHTFWGSRLPRPTSTHDPVRVGYPPDPNKPPLVDKAEKITIDGWDFAQRVVTPRYLEARYRAFVSHMKEAHFYFLSPEEERKYFDVVVVPGHYCSIAGQYLMEHNRLDRGTRDLATKAYSDYLKNFVHKKYGIRSYYYNENFSEKRYRGYLKEERDILIKHGIIRVKRDTTILSSIVSRN